VHGAGQARVATPSVLRCGRRQRSRLGPRCTGDTALDGTIAFGVKKPVRLARPQGVIGRRTSCAWRAVALLESQGRPVISISPFCLQPHSTVQGRRATISIWDSYPITPSEAVLWRDIERDPPCGRLTFLHVKTGNAAVVRPCALAARGLPKTERKVRNLILRASESRPSLAQRSGAESSIRACEKLSTSKPRLHLQDGQTRRHSNALRRSFVGDYGRDNDRAFDDFSGPTSAVVHDDLHRGLCAACLFQPLERSTWTFQARTLHQAAGCPPCATISASTLRAWPLALDYLERMEFEAGLRRARSLLPSPLRTCVHYNVRALQLQEGQALTGPQGDPASEAPPQQLLIAGV